MATSYTWHPGADGLGLRWPLTPPLMVDELLSSWLVRVALAHGCSPSALTSLLWPSLRVWTLDFDRGLETQRLFDLALHTGISVNAVQLSTLRQVADLLLGDRADKVGVWPWLLVLGCRSRRHAGGLLCCPECMKLPIPYYRIQWRLAWHTSCPVHGVNLIDCCPQCRSPLQPGLLAAGAHLSKCHSCGVCFGSCEQKSPLPGAFAFQRYADSLVGGHGSFGGVALEFAQWMQVARAMISFLQLAARQRSRGLLRVCDSLGVNVASLSPALLGLPFEFLAESERSRLLEGAWALMSAGPDRFLAEATSESLPASVLHVPNHGAPNILLRLAGELKIHSPHQPNQKKSNLPRTQLVVLRMWLRLMRRMRRDGLC